MPLQVSSTCAHHQEVKIALQSLWYHHTYRWLSSMQEHMLLHTRRSSTHSDINELATYKCDDTRGCVM